jgi:hypothetical protein
MPFCSYQPDQTLGQFFHGFVKGLAGAVAMLSQKVVLGFHDAGKSSHEDAAFAGQVAVDFIFESGGEKIPGADGDAHGQGAFPGAAGGVLKMA